MLFYFFNTNERIMGRTAIYKSKEEALAAQKQQIKAAKEKYHQLRQQYLDAVSNRQLRRVTLLNRNVIKDEALVIEITEKVKAYINAQTQAETNTNVHSQTEASEKI